MYHGFRIFLCCLLGSACLVSAWSQTKLPKQDDAMVTPPHDERYAWPIVSIGAGATFYTGGIHSPRNLSKFSGTRWGVNAQVEQRFGKYVGAKANIFYGMTAGERHSFTQFDNFQSRLISGDLRFAFHLDHLVGKKQVVAPYVAVGVGYVNYRTKSDLQDTDGKAYHLWDDGSLRDQSQAVQTNGDPLVLKRDYKYETVIQKSGNTITFPLEAGIRFKMHDYWDFGVGYTHTFLLNRFMPSTTTKMPDNYGYASATVYWYLGQLK